MTPRMYIKKIKIVLNSNASYPTILAMISSIIKDYEEDTTMFEYYEHDKTILFQETSIIDISSRGSKQ